MNTVTFYNKEEEVHVLFKESKIVYKNKMYDIKTVINTDTVARFSFENFSCKITRNLLSMTNSGGSSQTFFFKEDTDPAETQESWETFMLYKGSYISLNSGKTKIKINDTLVDVTVKEFGIFTDYETTEGVLRIFKDSSRNPQWNNMYLSRLT